MNVRKKIGLVFIEGWADRSVVSAPGTFAAAVLETLYPEKAEMIGQARAMFAREYAEAS